MADAARDATKRFAQDLRQLREQAGLSLQELHKATRVPNDLLETFEEDGLYDHPVFNRVYLRSLVRAYAQRVDVAPQRALAALEEALAGSYQEGGLLKKPQPQPKPEEREEADEKPEAAAAAAAAAGPESELEAEEPEQPEPQPQKKPEPAPHPRPKQQTQPAEPKKAEKEATASPPGRKETSPPAADRKPAQQRKSTGGGVPVWVYGVAGAVVLAGLIWLFVSLLGGDGDPDPVAETVPVDTTEAVQRPEPEEPEPEPVALDDSLRVRVIAEGGPVRGLRVTPDDELRRPYWIEQGQSETFSAANRLIIENRDPEQGPANQLELINLELQGYPYPTGEVVRDAQNRIVLDRPTAQAHLDTVRVASQ